MDMKNNMKNIKFRALLENWDIPTPEFYQVMTGGESS
tara:strand:- start:2076 stop:2186 length:111 start_codon:yes stop_codon:yes gene_type:complete